MECHDKFITPLSARTWRKNRSHDASRPGASDYCGKVRIGGDTQSKPLPTMPADLVRLVKFVGGPCDGLECRDRSPDRFESSIAIVWSLFRIGCGGPLTSPEVLNRRYTRRMDKPEAAPTLGTEFDGAFPAHYCVIRRTLQRGTLITVAWHSSTTPRPL